MATTIRPTTHKAWKLYYNPKEILPLDDDQAHCFGKGCLCHPYLRDGTLVHNSFDKREFLDADELAAVDRSVRLGLTHVQ